MRVAGFGFRRGATLASLQDALARALSLDRSGAAPTLLAAPHDKAGAPPLRALATGLGLPVVAIAASHAAAMPTLTDRAAVRHRRGTGSTAEAVALAAARSQGGAGAVLAHPRAISSDRLATCAIADFASTST